MESFKMIIDMNLLNLRDFECFVGDFVKHIIARAFVPFSVLSEPPKSSETLTNCSHGFMEFEAIMIPHFFWDDRRRAVPIKKSISNKKTRQKIGFDSLQHEL